MRHLYYTLTTIYRYIGNGHGDGEPYTTALVLAVFLLPLQYLRVHAPPHIAPLVILYVDLQLFALDIL